MRNTDYFRLPTPMKITGRSSSITNVFITSIIPVIRPTEDQVLKALSILNMNPDTICCAYCGDTYSEWDHLFPLVINKKPTGYITEIANLVPSCGKCNQSKGNKNWEEWITGNAKLSPMRRNLPDLDNRIENIRLYIEYWKRKKVVFEDLVDPELWKNHWQNHQRINELLTEAQEVAKKVSQQIVERSK